MAKLFQLNYHPDTTLKRTLSCEDVEFLKELQKELNTQDNLGNAEPIFWVLAGTKKEYGFNEDSCDGVEVYDTGNHENHWEFGDFFEHIISELDKRGYSTESSYTDTYLMHFEIFKEDKSVEDFCDMEEFLSWLDGNDFGTYGLSYYRESFCLIPDTLFLTHKAAREHLKRYGYNYPEDTHTYAMTAVRSPEVEKVWKLLREIDFLRIPVSENEQVRELVLNEEETVLIGTESYEKTLFTEKGEYVSEEAKRRDEEIYFYVPDDVFCLSDESLRSWINAFCV